MARPRSASVDLLRELVRYNRAVYDRYYRRIRRLPKRVAFRRRGIGHETLFDTLVHILHVQEVWLAYIVRGRNSDAELEALFRDPRRRPADWRAFEAYRRRVWAEVDRTLRGLTEARAARTVSAFWMPGRYTVRDGFFQATFEEAHHLGELIAAMWQDDREPPEMTWIDTRRALDPRRRGRQ